MVRRHARTFAGLLATALISTPVFAQDAEDAQTAKDDVPSAETALPESRPTITQEGGSDRCEIRRGFFARGDFGAFFTLGGSDFDAVSNTVSSNSVGNLQPFVGLTAGYDVLSMGRSNLSIGARFAAAFNSSTSAFISGGDFLDPAQAASTPQDFEMLQFGAAVDYTYLLSERLGLQFHGDGGIVLLGPDPASPAETVTGPQTSENSEFNPGGRAIAGVFSAGLGVEYYTLLNGFSVGLTTSFYGVLAEEFIPGLAIFVPIKYNF